MRHLLGALGIWLVMIVGYALTPSTLHAQRLDWKLEDFNPLTELPWDEEMTVPMEKVIFTIYHEPEFAVRRYVLDEYLRALPDAELGKALDLCLQFEGTQTPDDLVGYFIGMWAKRDPVACWERVKKLLDVVGVEEGWLGYDSWKSRPRITVRNWDAIKASKFWLGSRALSGFGAAVEQSRLPVAERTKLLREFAVVWITAFGEMPSSRESSGTRGAPAVPLAYIFSGSPMSRRGYILGGGNACISEIAARRYIKAFPAEAPDVIQQLGSKKTPDRDADQAASPSGPSRALYQVWADADLAGMVRWADTLKVGKTEDTRERYRACELVYIPKGLLMGRVDEKKRQQWMDQARSEGDLDELMEAWAEHDPKGALDAAVKLRDAEILEQVLRDAAYGPHGWVWNTTHPRFGVIRDYDYSSLPEELYREVFSQAAIMIMEQWGCLDVGEAARFGMKHLKGLGVVDQPDVLAFFRGENDDFADGGGILDRTFCALRVWAVTKPDEMKAWIGTLKEEDLRTALTWLAENPWGTGPEE